MAKKKQRRIQGRLGQCTQKEETEKIAHSEKETKKKEEGLRAEKDDEQAGTASVIRTTGCQTMMSGISESGWRWRMMGRMRMRRRNRNMLSKRAE